MVQVFFNNDALDPAAVRNTNFYQLMYTRDTASTDDDLVVQPVVVNPDPARNMVELVFAKDLSDYGLGAFRLRIGNWYQPILTASVAEANAGSSFYTPQDLSAASQGGWVFGDGSGPQSLILDGEIEAQPYDLEWPGANDEPGHRDLPANVAHRGPLYQRRHPRRYVDRHPDPHVRLSFHDWGRSANERAGAQPDPR